MSLVKKETQKLEIKEKEDFILLPIKKDPVLKKRKMSVQENVGEKKTKKEFLETFP